MPRSKKDVASAPVEPNRPDQGLRLVRSQQRRQEILKASRDVLSQGFSDFSMRRVAETAQVHLNTVQHHFGDLETLIEATVKEELDSYLLGYRDLTGKPGASPEADLFSVLKMGLIAVRSPGVRRFFIEAWAIGLQRPAIAQMLRSCYEDYRQTIKVIAQRINPALSDQKANHLATLIVALGEGLVVMGEWGGARMPAAGGVAAEYQSLCLQLLKPQAPGNGT